MSKDRVIVPDLDERTARLGRQWFAEIRQLEFDEGAKGKRRQAARDAEDSGMTDGLWDWLSGNAEAGDGGGD